MTVLRRAATLVRGFVKRFPKVQQLYCSFPAAQATKGKSQKIVYKTSYPSNGPSYYWVTGQDVSQEMERN